RQRETPALRRAKALFPKTKFIFVPSFFRISHCARNRRGMADQDSQCDTASVCTSRATAPVLPAPPARMNPNMPARFRAKLRSVQNQLADEIQPGSVLAAMARNAPGQEGLQSVAVARRVQK